MRKEPFLLFNKSNLPFILDYRRSFENLSKLFSLFQQQYWYSQIDLKKS